MDRLVCCDSPESAILPPWSSTAPGGAISCPTTGSSVTTIARRRNSHIRGFRIPCCCCIVTASPPSGISIGILVCFPGIRVSLPASCTATLPAAATTQRWWSSKKDEPEFSRSGARMPNTITIVEVSYEDDVVTARQRARQVARLLLFEEQDQTRISTAVSEIVRLFVHSKRVGRIEFQIEGATVPQVLLVTIGWSRGDAPKKSRVMPEKAGHD